MGYAETMEGASACIMGSIDKGYESKLRVMADDVLIAEYHSALQMKSDILEDVKRGMVTREEGMRSIREVNASILQPLKDEIERRYVQEAEMEKQYHLSGRHDKNRVYPIHAFVEAQRGLQYL